MACSRRNEQVSRRACPKRRACGGAARVASVMRYFEASAANWADWRWQVRHVVKTPDVLEKLVVLDADELANVRAAVAARLPFGVTPLLPDTHGRRPESGARPGPYVPQVFPPATYVREMGSHHGERERGLRLHARTRHVTH